MRPQDIEAGKSYSDGRYDLKVLRRTLTRVMFQVGEREPEIASVKTFANWIKDDNPVKKFSEPPPAEHDEARRGKPRGKDNRLSENKRLKILRLDRDGLKQKEIAKQCDVAQSTVSSVLGGRQKNAI